MSNTFKPETLAQIESAVPTSVPLCAVDIWRQAGGLSHCHVKNGLKKLVDAGRVLRTEETFRNAATMRNSQKRFLYVRVK